MRRFFSIIPLLLAFCISCEKPEGTSDSGNVALSLEAESAGCGADSKFVYVTADCSWTLSLEDEYTKPISWASLSKSSGQGNATAILSIQANPEKVQRSLVVKLSGANGKIARATFTQEAKGDEPIPPGPTPGPDDITPDPVANWMELPAMQNGLYFFTHPMTIDGKRLRNYSYAWDVDNMVAHWVAYPLNSRLKSGGSGRSDAWGLDPKLPTKYQPVLNKAYTNSSSWARGHQIPSADRQIYEYNVQTFYGVNMTPQNQKLNGGIWGNLENYVRDRSSSFDTLYVVTGCTLEGNKGVVYDNVGKAVTIPGGYFKALLGYKKAGTVGNTGIQGGYTGIAFFFKNEAVPGNDYMNYSMTISELEKKVGIDFFVNLKTALPSLSDKIESTKDNWWNK